MFRPWTLDMFYFKISLCTVVLILISVWARCPTVRPGMVRVSYHPDKKIRALDHKFRALDHRVRHTGNGGMACSCRGRGGRACGQDLGVQLQSGVPGSARAGARSVCVRGVCVRGAAAPRAGGFTGRDARMACHAIPRRQYAGGSEGHRVGHPLRSCAFGRAAAAACRVLWSRAVFLVVAAFVKGFSSATAAREQVRRR